MASSTRSSDPTADYAFIPGAVLEGAALLRADSPRVLEAIEDDIRRYAVEVDDGGKPDLGHETVSDWVLLSEPPADVLRVVAQRFRDRGEFYCAGLAERFARAYDTPQERKAHAFTKQENRARTRDEARFYHSLAEREYARCDQIAPRHGRRESRRSPVRRRGSRRSPATSRAGPGSDDPGGDPDDDPEQPDLKLWRRHPRWGSCTPNLLRVLLREGAA